MRMVKLCAGQSLYPRRLVFRNPDKYYDSSVYCSLTYSIGIRNESNKNFEQRNDNKGRQEPHSIHRQDDGHPRVLFHGQSPPVTGPDSNSGRSAAANRAPNAVSDEGDRLHRTGCTFKQLRAGHKVVRIGQHRLGQHGHLARGKTLHGPFVQAHGGVFAPGRVQRLRGHRGGTRGTRRTPVTRNPAQRGIARPLHGCGQGAAGIPASRGDPTGDLSRPQGVHHHHDFQP